MNSFPEPEYKTYGTGPNHLVLSAGVYGDQPLPVEILKQLQTQIGNLKPFPEEWTATLITKANPAAFAANQRFIDTNLNRIFDESLELYGRVDWEPGAGMYKDSDSDGNNPDEDDGANDVTDGKWVQALPTTIEGYCAWKIHCLLCGEGRRMNAPVLIDIHAPKKMPKAGPCAVCNISHLDLAARLPVPSVVVKDGKPGTLARYADDMGGAGITLIIPRFAKGDLGKITEGTSRVVHAVLQDTPLPPVDPERQFYLSVGKKIQKTFYFPATQKQS